MGSYDRSFSAGSHQPSTTWTQLAATYEGTTQCLCVNDTSMRSLAQSGRLGGSSSPLWIRGITMAAGEFFQVLVDEVCLYNRAISQSEIAAMAEQPVTQSAQTAQPPRVCAPPCAVWHDAATPRIAVNPEPGAVDMGLRARTEVAGHITGACYCESAHRTSSRLGRPWISSGRPQPRRPSPTS